MNNNYVSREKENFIKRCFKGWGYWFIGTFMCFFLCTTLLVLMSKVLILKVFVAFCTTMITLGLYFNWAHYSAKRDRNAVKFHNMEYDKNMPIKMAIIAPIISYVMLILLYLCKLGVIKEGFMSIYLICQIWILPYVTMFSESRTINDVSWAGMIGITFVTLLQPATIIITYICTYRDIDVVKNIFYKNDNLHK